MSQNPYDVKVRRWSPSGSIVEALTAVQEEVAQKLKTVNPPLEIRVEAMETFFVEAGAIAMMTAISHGHDVERSIDTVRTATEFLRLDHLHEAIELYELQQKG
jgi:hypothetical protein